MAKQNSKFFGSKIEALEDAGFVVSTEFTVETPEQALALQSALVTFATGGAAPAAAPEAPAKPAVAATPAAAPAKPKPAAEAPAKPAATPAKPPKAELPPADEDEDEDEDEDGLPEEITEAETLKDIVSYYVDQSMKVNAVVKAVRALKGHHPVVDRFDDAKLDGRVKSLFEALAD